MKYFLLLLFLFTQNLTIACECIEVEHSGTHVRQFYNWYDKCFIGNLLSFENDIYKFEVMQPYKGTTFRDTLWGTYNNSCSLSPKEKGLWMVYATTKDTTTNEIDIDACNLTRSLNSNRQYLYDDKVLETDNYELKKEGAENLVELSILQSLKELNLNTEPEEIENTIQEQSPTNWLSIIAIILALISIFLNFKLRKKV